jgi:PDZ domain
MNLLTNTIRRYHQVESTELRRDDESFQNGNESTIQSSRPNSYSYSYNQNYSNLTRPYQLEKSHNQKREIPSSLRNSSNYHSTQLCQAIPLGNNNQQILSDCFSKTINAIAITEEGDIEITRLAVDLVLPYDPCPSISFGLQEISGYTRPMFTFCQIMRPSADYPLGIYFDNDQDNVVRIRSIDWDSPFARTDSLRKGDHVIAVNGLSTRHLTSDQVFEIARTSTDSISLTVREENGDMNTVLNSVQKSSADCKIGITLRNEKYGGSRLLVSAIRENGIFSTSLLSPGHEVILINNIPCCSLKASDACELTRFTNGAMTFGHTNEDFYHATILSRVPLKFNSFATVVSCEPKKNLRERIKKSRYHHFFEKLTGFGDRCNNNKINCKQWASKKTFHGAAVATSDSFDS